MISGSPSIRTLLDGYLPGYKVAGLIQPIASMIEQVVRNFLFRMVARDRVLEDTRRYSHG
ncbi:MAG: hypothetical protein MK179_11940 [Pirellulaceae bacterium]|nr:hypothetical protein [Pirellulaceae bacterium]